MLCSASCVWRPELCRHTPCACLQCSRTLQAFACAKQQAVASTGMASPKRGVGFLTELKSWHTENFQPASSRNFNTTALYGLKVTSSTSGRLVCDFPVTKRAQNLSGCLHGGCIGALVSVAPHGGVSVHMSIDYFRPTPGADVCEVDAKVTELGRALAFSEVVIKNKTTGQITARGTDIKFVPAMQPSDSQGKGPIGTPRQSASPAAAIAFISDLVSAYDDDFDPEATSNFEATALYGLKDISATEGNVVCTLPVRPPVENIYHTLHGGCIATLVDAVGYAAILTIRQHLSTTLQVSVDYLSELPENEDCEATGTVSHIGKSTATATVQLRVKRTGRLAAQGTHVVMFSSIDISNLRCKI